MFFNLKPPHCPRTSWLNRPPDDTQPIPPFYGTKRYSASGFLFLSNSLLQETFFKSHSDVHKKDRRLSLLVSPQSENPDGRSWGEKKKSVSPLPKSCDSFWSRQNSAAPSCEGYRAAGGELRSYSKYGTQLDFSPFPSVRPSFALL